MNINQLINQYNKGNMSYDKVKKTLTEQVKEKKIKLKDARKAVRGIQADAKKSGKKPE